MEIYVSHPKSFSLIDTLNYQKMWARAPRLLNWWAGTKIVEMVGGTKIVEKVGGHNS